MCDTGLITMIRVVFRVELGDPGSTQHRSRRSLIQLPKGFLDSGPGLDRCDQIATTQQRLPRPAPLLHLCAVLESPSVECPAPSRRRQQDEQTMQKLCRSIK